MATQQKKLTRFARAFKATQDDLGIATSALAQESGIHRNRISDFRTKGSGVSFENLEKLLEAMDRLSPGALAAYSRRLGSAPLDLSQLSQAEMADLILAIGKECTKRVASGEEQHAALVA